MDLGHLESPVLTFGGPYGNLQATAALKAEAERLGIPPRRVICTGDVAAYCAEPEDTVALLAAWGVPTAMGNCEEALGADADDCGCGFPSDSACDALARRWYAHARGALSEGAKAWMRSLPRRLDFRLGGLGFAVVHGGADGINRFLFASAPDAALAREIARAGTDGVIAGHCGLPFTRRIGGRLWHNPGAIGMPANDGTPDAWYGLLVETPGGGVVAHHRRLAYDHAAAAAAVRRHGLPEAYAAALETGLWPSLDVLPTEERAATGRPLDARTLGDDAGPTPRA